MKPLAGPGLEPQNPNGQAEGTSVIRPTILKRKLNSEITTDLESDEQSLTTKKFRAGDVKVLEIISTRKVQDR